MDREDLVYNRRGALGPGQVKALEGVAKLYGPARYALGHAAQDARAQQDGIQKDIAEGRVEVIDGEVVFQRSKIPELPSSGVKVTEEVYGLLTACLGAYAVSTTGRAPLGFAPGVNLLPGPYRLYVAPRSGYVVGAEVPPGGDGSREHTRRMQNILLEVQRISAEALAHNRRGVMTEEQKSKIRSAPTNWRGYSTAILILFFGAFTYWSVARAMASGKSLFSFQTMMGALVTLVFAVWLPFAIREQRKANTGGKADADEGRVEAREGTISKTHNMHRLSLSFTLRMSDHAFDVTNRPALWAAVVEGHRYRAYIAPRSGTLMALELVETEGARG